MSEKPNTNLCCEESPQLYAQLDEYIAGLNIDSKDPQRKETLSLALHKAQTLFGYIPRELQIYIAKKYNISHAEVSGVISFYNFFSTTPKGKINISICMGTACYVNGSEKILQDFETTLGIIPGDVTSDGRFSIQCLRCVGACGLAPVVMVNDKVYGKVKPGDAKNILERYLVEESVEISEDVKHG